MKENCTQKQTDHQRDMLMHAVQFIYEQCSLGDKDAAVALDAIAQTVLSFINTYYK